MCWIPLDPGYPDGEPIKKEDKMYVPTIEDQIAKLEDELGNLKMWLEAYEEDMDLTVTEIENRIKYVERFNHDGR